MQPTFIPPVANRKNIRGKRSFLPIIIGVGVVLAILIGVGLMLSSTANSPVAAMDRLNARMNSLSLYVEQGRKSARSGDLIKVNSDAAILISGDTAALKMVTGQAGAAGKTGDVIAEEKQAAQTILAELKTAAIDGRFDREYITTLREQLESTQTLLSEINQESSRPDVKDATKAAFEHFEIVIVSLKAIQL
jgi:hypothetical protein